MSRSRRQFLVRASTVSVAACAPGTLWAQAAAGFAQRPLNLVVPFAAGGIADLTARAVAEGLSKQLNASVVVENKPSAGSIVASQAVLQAKPDGHTLLLMSNGHAVSVGLFKKLPYDPLKDFAPISMLGSFDLGLFVDAASRWTSLAQLVQAAKAKAGQIKVGSVAIGSTQHLSAKLFEHVADIDLLTVPYRGTPAVITALRSGEIDVAFEIVGPMMAQVNAGAVRPLAVTSDRRNPALPDTPTVQQAGVAGYNVSSWNALAAPAGTPPETIDLLNRHIRQALETPAIADKLNRLGMRLQASSPQGMHELMTAEIRRWGDVIRRAKIEPEA